MQQPLRRRGDPKGWGLSADHWPQAWGSSPCLVPSRSTGAWKGGRTCRIPHCQTAGKGVGDTCSSHPCSCVTPGQVAPASSGLQFLTFAGGGLAGLSPWWHWCICKGLGSLASSLRHTHTQVPAHTCARPWVRSLPAPPPRVSCTRVMNLLASSRPPRAPSCEVI